MSIDFSKYSDLELAFVMSEKGKNSDSAFMEFYKRYATGLNAYCAKILNDRVIADDVFQDTFIKFYETVNPKQYSNVSGYLIKIARNLCLNHKRNRKNKVDITEMEFLSYDLQNYENVQLVEFVNTAVDLLDEEYKEALVLREYNGLEYDEIAKIMNISEINAKTRVCRAKKKVKDLLKPYLKEINS